jgi:RNA polymerase sigma factor (sigma-70 family)
MHADDRDDLNFARQLSEGEPVAVLRFEARYRRVLHHAFGRACARWRPEVPVEAEDYVQDFIGFLFDDGGRRLRSYAGRANFGSWLYTVALRYFQRALSRLAKDRRSGAVLTELPDRGDRNPESLAAAALDAERLRAAVSQLSADDQLHVRLFFVEGQNASEVARTLGKGTSAVRMRKMRILERLRSLLESPEDES